MEKTLHQGLQNPVYIAADAASTDYLTDYSILAHLDIPQKKKPNSPFSSPAALQFLPSWLMLLITH